MRNFLVAIFVFLLLSGLRAECGGVELSLRKRDRFPESFVLNLPEEEGCRWRRIHQSAHPNNAFVVCEYIPKDQLFDCWTQMVSITYLPDTCSTISDILGQTKDQIFTVYRKSPVKWIVHCIDENEAVYEWSLPIGHYKMSRRSHLVRLVKTPTGFHSLVYTKKTACLDEITRQNWMDYFYLAKIKGPEPEEEETPDIWNRF